jgi:hypothetical protein
MLGCAFFRLRVDKDMEVSELFDEGDGIDVFRKADACPTRRQRGQARLRQPAAKSPVDPKSRYVTNDHHAPTLHWAIQKNMHNSVYMENGVQDMCN